MPRSLLLDENAKAGVAQGLRSLGFDVEMARDHGLLQTSDAIILDAATRMGRVVFTHDYRDYTRLARERFAQQRPHGGILLAEVGDVGYHVRRLAIWLRENDDADLSFFCDWLPKYPGRL